MADPKMLAGSDLEPKIGIWGRLVSSGFRLLYNEMAWSYDTVSWIVSLGQWREWQMAALQYVVGKSVLEIAHGPGHLLIALESAGFHVVGLDQSAYMGRQARTLLERAGVWAPLVTGKAQSLPFNSGVFDTILITFPTSFIIEPEVIKGIYRVLRENGRVVVVPEARLTGRGPIYRLIEWLFVITGQRYNKTNDIGESEPFLLLSTKMKRVGFVVSLIRISQDRSEITVIIADK